MTILYNKQGIAVDVPDNAVEDALKNGFTRNKALLSVLIKNYDPDIAQADIPVDIQGSLKQVEFILQNQSDSSINVGYGNLGNETLIPGGIPASGRLRLTAYAGTTQALQLPTANLICSDNDNFVELGSPIYLTATQVISGTITKVEFYSGSKLIGTAISAPYTQSYSFTATGTYRVYAKVYSGTDYTTTNSIQIVAIPNKRQDRNLLPIVTITAPTTGTVNQAITITAVASDPDGSVNKVEFYVNDIKQGEDLTSPYTQSFTPTQTGVNYVFRARVFDNLGAFSDSNLITFFIPTPSVPLPTVVISNSVLNAGVINTAITLTATASISGDTLSGTQFKVNGANQGTSQTGGTPSVSWTPTTKGSYSITATSTGILGGSSSSATKTVVIYDTKLTGGANGAGTSLGAVAQDYILFDNNQSAGGNASIMNIFVSGVQVAAFNYPDTAYVGRPFHFFNSGNSTLYSGTIQGTVNF